MLCQWLDLKELSVMQNYKDHDQYSLIYFCQPVIFKHYLSFCAQK